MNPDQGWRALQAERTDEGVEAILGVAGVVGVVLGGSVARGNPWPLSDIDLLPVWADGATDRAACDRAQARMVDWWAASGRAQTLDVGWIGFEVGEIKKAIRKPFDFAELVADDRWFHGLDKAFCGVGFGDPSATALADFATAIRFDNQHRRAREARWWSIAEAEKRRAESSDTTVATLGVRAAARALRLVMVERWGERLGSMGREWTTWESMAQTHGFDATAIVELAHAESVDALERAEIAPLWLRERIRLSLAGRRLVGDLVSDAKNARDQLAAFEVHVTRRTEPPYAGWLDVPDPDLVSKRQRLIDLMASLARDA